MTTTKLSPFPIMREDFVTTTGFLMLAATIWLTPMPVWAQGPVPLGLLPCEQQLACQQQRVLDLKDHREWLEGQVALAKALLNDARQALAKKEADLAACRATTDPH